MKNVNFWSSKHSSGLFWKIEATLSQHFCYIKIQHANWVCDIYYITYCEQIAIEYEV